MGCPPRGGTWLSLEGSAEQTAPDRWQRQWGCCKRKAGQIRSRWSRGGSPQQAGVKTRKGWGWREQCEVQEKQEAPTEEMGVRVQAGLGHQQPRGQGCQEGYQGSGAQAPLLSGVTPQRSP